MKSVIALVLSFISLGIFGQFEEGIQIDWSSDVELTNGSKTIVGVHEVDRDTLLLIYQKKVSGHSDSRDHLLRWVNANTGELIRKREYDIYIPGDQFPRHSLIDKEGNIIIVGESQCSNATHTNDPGRYDFYITKYSPSGNLLWYKCYGTSANDAMAINVFETVNNQYLAFTHIHRNDGDVSDHKGESDIWMLWIDGSDGTLRKEKTIGGSKDDFVEHIIKKPNDSYSLIVKTKSKDNDFAFLLNKQAEESYVETSINLDGETLSSNYLYGKDSLYFFRVVNYGWSEFLSDGIFCSLITQEEDSIQFSNINQVTDTEQPIFSSFNGNYYHSLRQFFEKDDKMLIFGDYDNVDFTSTFGEDFWNENPTWVSLYDLRLGKVLWETRLPDEIVDRYGNQSLGSHVYQIKWLQSRYNSDVIYGSWGHRSFKLTPNKSTSISAEHLKEHQLAIYPNPNNTGILNTNLKADYSIIDLQGRLIKTFQQSTVLDVSEVQSGTYILRHEDGTTARVVIE